MSDFGLYFFNARWYDSSLGRFAQADTVIPGAGDPQAWDRYAYVKNSPLRYSDPSGHKVCDEVGADEECYSHEDEDIKDIFDGRDRGNRAKNRGGGGNICNGLNPSIVCKDQTLIRTGSVTTDPVYPTKQPPSNWTGTNAGDPTGVPWLDAILLGIDWVGRFTYSSGPSLVSGQHVYATVNYEVHSSDIVGQYREISGIEIVNNTNTVMNIDNIRTNIYRITPSETISVGARDALQISFDFDTSVTGNPVTINLSNGSLYAQIVADIFK